ncbi:MAG TPA: NADH-quinone oxidoreductase subunit I [Saprospiraceae bacterium]|nr:NADH-quinone oxidoreductase subunit I [Saprospiraceae bacterium]HMV23626.1 NADH-quinone oxidoreductase subunit I [Saprospiraceae bacterium]HMX83924.1 NADH-quinone oxidoreductase subunit I [Saprospiraceae bacterium]HMZ73909.1 NADH-quinone oxidoreductase subunit I [Saprospiraceae bacterium]HNE65980.1 NADH-quinone oxidoreductase subunit I [Saprospiraceae bacterium]
MYRSLTAKRKNVSAGQRELTFMERMYLPAILKGMKITIGHLFKKKVSLNYPEVKREFSDFYRGMHVLKRDENGAENCTACGMCALACPAEAITIDAAERKPGEEHLYREEKYAAKYEINMLRCIYCGLCEEACPKDAIYLTERIVPAYYKRKDFIYGKDILVEDINNRVDITKRKQPIKKA